MCIAKFLCREPLKKCLPAYLHEKMHCSLFINFSFKILDSFNFPGECGSFFGIIVSNQNLGEDGRRKGRVLGGVVGGGAGVHCDEALFAKMTFGNERKGRRYPQFPIYKMGMMSPSPSAQQELSGPKIPSRNYLFSWPGSSEG